MPETQTKTSSDQIPESVRVRQQLDAIALNVAASAQIVFSLDPSGVLIAEMPGINGAVRRKIDLPADFLTRNPELHALMTDEILRLREVRKAAALAKKADYIDPRVAREQRNAEIAKEKEKQWLTWLDTLPKDRRELEIKKRDERIERSRNAIDARARDIWNDVASNHDIALANKVIPDPNRRPRRKVIVISQDGTRKELAPRTGIETHNTSRGTKKIDPTLAMDL